MQRTLNDISVFNSILNWLGEEAIARSHPAEKSLKKKNWFQLLNTRYSPQVFH